MCTTTTHWATHISTECSVGGSGQCDGHCVDHPGTACTCACHTAFDLPFTVSEVRDWHDAADDVVASFPFNEGDDISLNESQQAALAEAERRNNKPVDGRVFVVLNGQHRTVVVERY